MTCFQDTAEAILGQNSAYVGQLKDSVSVSLSFSLSLSSSLSLSLSLSLSVSFFLPSSQMKAWPEAVVRDTQAAHRGDGRWALGAGLNEISLVSAT